MAVITMSGQSGSGTREIGRLAAGQLELNYVDQQILVEAARALGVPMESVASLDERTASFSERLADMLRRFLERSAAAGASDPMLGSDGLDIVLSRTYSEAAAGEGLQQVTDERYVEALTGIVRDLAEQGDVLIIGRGSQVILQEWPGAFHVLTVAPLEHRIRDYASREGVTPEEAEKHVHERDKGRAAFHRKFFKVDADDPALYHLTVNSGFVAAEEAAALICEAAERNPTRSAPS